MVKIHYSPIKEITIHDIQKYTLEDFVEIHGSMGSPIGWCEGLIYSVGHFHQTDDIIEEKLQGIEHWQVIEYAEMKKFSNIVTTKNNIECTVIDQTKHAKIVEIINFVKENKIE